MTRMFIMDEAQHAQAVASIDNWIKKIVSNHGIVQTPVYEALAMLKAMQPLEPCGWAMFRDGHFYDAIHPDNHTRHEGEYVRPLYTPTKD